MSGLSKTHVTKRLSSRMSDLREKIENALSRPVMPGVILFVGILGTATMVGAWAASLRPASSMEILRPVSRIVRHADYDYTIVAGRPIRFSLETCCEGVHVVTDVPDGKTPWAEVHRRDDLIRRIDIHVQALAQVEEGNPDG